MDSKNNHDGSDNSEACVDNPSLEEVIDTKPAALDGTENYKDNDGEAEDISIKDKEKQYRMRMERDELNLVFNSTDEDNEMRPGSESVRGPGYTSERSFKMENPGYTSERSFEMENPGYTSERSFEMENNESAMMLHAELVEEGIEDSERERIANAALEELVSGAVKAEVVAVGDDEEQSKSNLLLFGVCIAIVVVVGVVVGVVIGTKENDSDSDETLNRDIPTNISAPTISPTSYLNRENFFSTTVQLYNAVYEYISGLRNASIDLEFMPVYQLYGPIESWNVSGLSNFSLVFNLWYLDEDEEHPFDADLGNWDVSRATTLIGMFYYCHKFQGIGLEKWDVSKVTDFSYMFAENYEFNNKDLSNWNTSNAQNMEYMFDGTSIFDGSGVETWDVSRVESMEGIFSYSNFAGDVSMWNTSSVEDMFDMFSNSQFDGDVTNFNTERVTDMTYMFEKTNFDGDVSHFDTSLVLSMGYMFAESPFSGRNGDISGWDVTTCTDMEAMFFSAPNFKQDLSTWNVENVENFDRMFFRAEQFNQSLCTWGPLMIEKATVEEMFKFSGCDNTSDPVISIGGPLCEIC